MSYCLRNGVFYGAWDGQPPRVRNRLVYLSVENRGVLKMRDAGGRPMQQEYIERVVDFIYPAANQLYCFTVLMEARETVLYGTAEAVGRIAGSFALVAREGKTVKMALFAGSPLALLSG